MSDKKTRITITIDPELLAAVKADAAARPQPVSAYIREAIRHYRNTVVKAQPVDDEIVLVK